jgi:hypothetical protein
MARTIHQRRSKLQEQRTAKDLGGYAHRGSGASDFGKSDARKPLDVRAECKTTTASSYILKLSDWEKIQGEALRGGLEAPVMQIEFQRGAGLNRKIAVIDWNYFLELRRNMDILEEAKAEARELNNMPGIGGGGGL